MDKKVTMSSLSAMMALATGKQQQLCENFLQELFSVISDELSRGESVRIKGLGTFKLVDVEARRSVDVSTGEPNEIPPHKKIIFVASKELAAIVNAPFEAFEAEEISDNLSTDELTGAPEVPEAPEIPSPATYADSLKPEEQEKSEEEAEEPEEAVEEIKEPQEAVEVSEETSDATEELDEEMIEAEGVEESEYQEERPGRFGWGFLTGFISALGVAAVAGILWWGFGSKDDASIDEDGQNVEMAGNQEVIAQETGVAQSDSLSLASTDKADGEVDVPTRPSDTPVLDTISTTRFLTTMAQDHYGNFNLWPIIYDENSKILGHPDRIKPGTQVVIPSLSKYGIDPHNRDHINNMKERGKAIYSKYK